MFALICMIILILSIYLGARLGGLGIAFASGLGLYLFTMVLGITPGNLPVNVVFIIIAVIGAIAVLELAGGLAYLVYLAEIILRKNPKYINFLAPSVTFFMTLFAGTGHTAYSIMPVIVEVAKEQGIRPVRPLSSAVVASQIAITASPVSAALIAFIGILEPLGISLLQLLAIVIPSAFLGVMLMSCVQLFFPQDLKTYKPYIANKNNALITKAAAKPLKADFPLTSKLAVLIFLVIIIAIMIYGLFPQLKPIYSNNKGIDNALLIVILMLLGSYIMTIVTKVDISKLTSQSSFKNGMSAALCVIGVAWLGDTIITYYKDDIKSFAGDFLIIYPWTFAFILFFISMLLYSQAATTVAMMPLGLALGLSPEVLIASFAAVSALFVLPTYPTLIAAVQMDYTGTTKMGKYVFNHSFLIPGILAVLFSVIIGFFIAEIVL